MDNYTCTKKEWTLAIFFQKKFRSTLTYTNSVIQIGGLSQTTFDDIWYSGGDGRNVKSGIKNVFFNAFFTSKFDPKSFR